MNAIDSSGLISSLESADPQLLALFGIGIVGGGYSAAKIARAISTSYPSSCPYKPTHESYPDDKPDVAQEVITVTVLPVFKEGFNTPDFRLPTSFDTRNITINLPAIDAQTMADQFKQGLQTRPIIDRLSGNVVGEITIDGSRVIRYPHSDRGTPFPHWNLEDKINDTNLHVIIK